MDKLTYLKTVMTTTKLVENKNWYIACFTILIPDTTEKYKTNPIQFMPVRTTDGISFVNITENGIELVSVSDFKKDEPLFRFKDEVNVDNSWMSSIEGKITTKIGNLIINKLLFDLSVGNRIPFINGHITDKTIEKIFIERVTNHSPKNMFFKTITVKEMIEIVDRATFLSSIAEIVNITATEKNITRPPNIDKVKNDLMKEYEGQLSDPVKVVELENKLRDLDEEYLKDDPTNGIVLAGKSKAARKKLFLMFGKDKGFIDKEGSEPILNSLEDGLSTNEEDFSEYMNGLRFGSYARGALTAVSGTVTKVMLRSLGSLVIADIDCGTTQGVVRLIDKSMINKLVNREVKIANKWQVLVNEEEASKLIGKEVEIRSAMYCKAPKNTLCYHCTSHSFQNTPEAIYSLSTDVSSIIMKNNLSLMHGVTVSTTELSLDDLVT